MNSTQNKYNNTIIFFMVMLFTIFVSHHIMVLLHEWAHGTAAWGLGYKSSPFNIHYGDWTLFHVDENVNYKQILADGHGLHVSMIAGSAHFANMMLFLMSLYSLGTKKIQKNIWVYQFVFWFAVMNVAQTFGYIPIRGFTSGDVRNFLSGFSGSTWMTFIPGTLFSLWGLWQMFFNQLPKFYKIMSIGESCIRLVFLLILVLVVFGYYGVMISLLKQQTIMLVCSIILAVFTLVVCTKKYICIKGNSFIHTN